LLSGDVRDGDEVVVDLDEAADTLTVKPSQSAAVSFDK
jgi:ATP-dependent Clp protease ATP-binding subunit ClpB